MSTQLEERVAALEEEVARLKESLQTSPPLPWWEKIAGTFADDPLYEEAMRLGQEYRQSLREEVDSDIDQGNFITR